ncbi:MAG: hypothetical protein BWX45_00919 [Deltaproteobacteria bacterium ADurb.Bin002]|nr:MAG: hypothetical protein BWX45_00919 [Deltaproteobacteria bacterium ADurb.Bin002]
MQTSGGVHDHHAVKTGFDFPGGVENNGRGIGVHFLLDDRRAHTSAPHLQLFDGRRAKGIGGNQDNLVTIPAQHMGQFADGGGFSAAVDADGHDHKRLVFRDGERLFHLSQNGDHALLQNFFNLRRVGKLPALDPLLDVFNEIKGKLRAHVRRNHQLFQFVIERRIQFPFAENELIQIFGESVPGFGESRFEFVE